MSASKEKELIIYIFPQDIERLKQGKLDPDMELAIKNLEKLKRWEDRYVETIVPEPVKQTTLWSSIEDDGC